MPCNDHNTSRSRAGLRYTDVLGCHPFGREVYLTDEDVIGKPATERLSVDCIWVPSKKRLTLLIQDKMFKRLMQM